MFELTHVEAGGLFMVVVITTVCKAYSLYGSVGTYPPEIFEKIHTTRLNMVDLLQKYCQLKSFRYNIMYSESFHYMIHSCQF